MASRTLALGSRYGSTRFWLSAFCIALMPSSIGHQDIAALLSHRAPPHSHRHLLASPFGTIEPATFSCGIRPIGTAIPRPPAIELIDFDPRTGGAQVWSLGQPVRLRHRSAQFDYPEVNRARKGDRLPIAHPALAPAKPVSLPQLQPISAPPAAEPIRPPVTPAASPAPLPPVAPHAQAPSVTPAVEHTAAEIPADVPTSAHVDGSPVLGTASLAYDDAEQDRSAQIYFGPGMTDAPSGLEAWAPGAEPVLATPSFNSGVSLDPLEQSDEGDTPESAADAAPNPQSPALRLGLAGKARDKAEKCLAEAVYFEARGEPLRGQQAVAQVVMNRVFSGYYPSKVCGVVLSERRPLPRLPVHLRLRSARILAASTSPTCGCRPSASPRTSSTAKSGSPISATPRTITPLGAPELGARDDQALQTRRAHVLSAARLGQRRIRAGLGHAGEHLEGRPES